MIKRKVKCPKCGSIQSVSGSPLESVEVVCAMCGNKGRVVLPEDGSIIDAKNNLVVLKNLTKRYKDLLALDHVSFSLKPGEVFGYIGPNGAGKTTTIKLMVGLLSEDEGSCLIDGFEMPKDKINIHRLIGYLPQNVSFQSWRTVDHALFSFGRLSGMPDERIEQRIVELLDLFELSHVRAKKVSELSGGMMQKIGLVQALLHEPKLLILDEPLAGLDPDSRFKVKEIIKKISQQGTTVFFSSHILSDVQDIASRIGILNYGHIEAFGTLDELKAKFVSEHVLELEVDSSFSELSFLSSVAGVDFVEKIKDNVVRIHMRKDDDSDELRNKLLVSVLEAGFKVRKFAPLSPNLDELYQSYVAVEVRS